MRMLIGNSIKIISNNETPSIYINDNVLSLIEFITILFYEKESRIGLKKSCLTCH